MNNKKFKNMLNLSMFLFGTGVFFAFINLPIGLLFIFAFLVSAITMNVKYPNELKEFREKQKNTTKAMPETTLNKFQFFQIEHISGIEHAKIKEKCELCFSPGEFTFYDKNDDFISSIKFEDLKNCEIYQEIEQKLKDKSPAVRAIVGGVLLGPIGAVAGGISGVTPTIKENKKYYLEFEHKDSDIFDNIIISAKYETLEKIKSLTIKE